MEQEVEDFWLDPGDRVAIRRGNSPVTEFGTYEGEDEDGLGSVVLLETGATVTVNAEWNDPPIGMWAVDENGNPVQPPLGLDS